MSDLLEIAGPFVEGRTTASQSDDTLEVINPSNGRLLFDLPVGCASDVDDAVSSARRAFDDERWSGAAPSHRKKVLHEFADLVERNACQLDALDAEEMGKPISEKSYGASCAASMLRFFAEAVDKVSGEVFVSDRRSFVAQGRHPRGVIGAITPWNLPTHNAIVKVGPALAAGNCVILKPSELSSRSATRLAHLAVSAGLPPAVFNLVVGLGSTVGEALALHPSVDMIAFTGSTVIGKRILEYAGRSNMKAVLAECGGKSPQIVFDDGVDLGAAADAVARSILLNQGQTCSAGSRLLVQRSIEHEILGRIVSRLSAPTIGDALDPKTTFGPLVSRGQCARVERYVEGAKTDGAELLVGGRRCNEESGGCFFEPTIFRNVSPQSAIAQEEVFGPVLSVLTFADEAEAMQIANDTIYGLAAYVWTADFGRAMRLATGIRSSVFVSSARGESEGAGYATSWEPSGQSGFGVEGGLEGLGSYMRRHTISLCYQ